MSETPDPPAGAPEVPGEPNPGRNNKGCLVGAGLLIVAMILGFVGCLNSGSKGDEPPTQGVAEYMAKDVCREAVRKGLKSPSSAKFSGESATLDAGSSSESSFVFDVVGVVESQNGFGAMVASDYTCTGSVPKVANGTNTGRVTSVQQR